MQNLVLHFTCQLNFTCQVHFQSNSSKFANLAMLVKFAKYWLDFHNFCKKQFPACYIILVTIDVVNMGSIKI